MANNKESMQKYRRLVTELVHRKPNMNQKSPEQKQPAVVTQRERVDLCCLLSSSKLLKTTFFWVL